MGNFEVSAETAAFFGSTPKPLLIDGTFVPSREGATFTAINPASGEALGAAAAGQAEDVDLAVAAARRALEQPSWSRMSPHDRSKLLLRIADTIEKHLEELTQIESLNNGMTLPVARLIVGGAVQTFAYYSGWATKIYGETNPAMAGMLNYTLREPVGVCGHIVPWNGPIGSAAWKLAASLVCGNTVVFKPAEQTPFSTIRLGELLMEAGVPPGVVNIVTGLGERAGAAIASHPGIDKVAFTGSTEVGKKILTASAGNLKRVTLELGGKSPSIIFPDADLDRAAATLTQGFCFLSGQICVAASRILVHETIYEALLERLVRNVLAFKAGDPFDPAVTMGPLISAEQQKRVTNYFDIARHEGADIRAGGSAIDRPGYFVQPTVIANARCDMRVAREEIFGPVTTVLRFSDEAEATRMANDSQFGLAASVWTQDFARAHRVAHSLRAGTVWINTYSYLDQISPFGGYKQSGIGRELGRQSLESYTEVKSVFAAIG